MMSQCVLLMKAIIHVNEDARALLKKLWRNVYRYNVKRLIPQIAGELNKDYLFSAGVKIVNR